MKKICIILISIVFIICIIFILNNNTSDTLNVIRTRGVLLVGTTGDYCPMSCYDKTKNEYIGFDIALSEDLAKSLNVKVKYVPTTWPTLMLDVKNKKFDIAISGITITNNRKKEALMSDGYLDNGKTILCRKEDVDKYNSLDAINKPYVKVMENPGGLNEKFVKENLPNSDLIIHNVNSEIPYLISIGKADVMITEKIEAFYYSKKYKNLALPLMNKSLTKGQIGMLIPNENTQLHKYVNKFINREKRIGKIDELSKQYIYNYTD